MKRCHKITYYIPAVLLTVILSFPALAATPAENQPNTQKTAAPVNGRVYAKEKANAYMQAFTAVYQCVVSKTSRYQSEKNFSLNPKDLFLCATPLQKFKESRILLDFGPPLVFESEKEEQAIRADAALIDGLHEHICGIFNQLVAIRQTKTQADLISFQKIDEWANNDATKELKNLQKLDELLKRYSQLKSNGRMVSTPFPHYETSDSNLKAMNAVVKELGKYISFNVDSGQLYPTNKGLFIVDYDVHSVKFNKNVDGCIRRIDGLVGKFENDKKWLINHNINDLLKLKSSNVFEKFELIPQAMLKDICERSAKLFELIIDILKQMRDGQGDSAPTKFLKQKVLNGTIFSPNANFSYEQSVRDVVAPLMLNTRDKNNRELKHHIRGQL